MPNPLYPSPQTAKQLAPYAVSLGLQEIAKLVKAQHLEGVHDALVNLIGLRADNVAPVVDVVAGNQLFQVGGAGILHPFPHSLPPPIP
jgi:hypothetical protein